MNLPTWKEYETAVHEAVSSKFREATVTADVRLEGKLSGASRQIDMLVEQTLAGKRLQTVVEAKHYQRPIDVKHVEAFIGALRDVGIPRGVMISSSGYTRAAAQRALGEDVEVDLDIFSLSEFLEWQFPGGLPYAGDNGVVLDAPLGWVL
jgi:hypothetical protein